MALFHKSGTEVSRETYDNLRKRNAGALSGRAELREVLEVRSHKRAPGFSLQERCHVKGLGNAS